MAKNNDGKKRSSSTACKFCCVGWPLLRLHGCVLCTCGGRSHHAYHGGSPCLPACLPVLVLQLLRPGQLRRDQALLCLAAIIFAAHSPTHHRASVFGGRSGGAGGEVCHIGPHVCVSSACQLDRIVLWKVGCSKLGIGCMRLLAARMEERRFTGRGCCQAGSWLGRRCAAWRGFWLGQLPG